MSIKTPQEYVRAIIDFNLYESHPVSSIQRLAWLFSLRLTQRCANTDAGNKLDQLGAVRVFLFSEVEASQPPPAST